MEPIVSKVRLGGGTLFRVGFVVCYYEQVVSVGKKFNYLCHEVMELIGFDYCDQIRVEDQGSEDTSGAFG